MYIVIEIQTSNGQASVLNNTYANLNTAYQAYYTILAAAAVSQVEVHTAILLNEHGGVVSAESFEHGE